MLRPATLRLIILIKKTALVDQGRLCEFGALASVPVDKVNESMANEVEADQGEGKSDDTPPLICGLIMPISATANHSEAHWAAVRTLIGRAIVKAEFSPMPVWENSATDRVSARIIGNIFQFPLVIADISDNNPNVMLELGLRLASKKPTIVVANTGAVIPFDIRDFHVLQYPSSLSMLEMEAFIEDLSGVLKVKYEASKKEGYTPFLGSVIVDVIKPEEREVSIQQYLIDRLDDISSKISNRYLTQESEIDPWLNNNVTTYVPTSIGSGFFFTSPREIDERTKGRIIGLTGTQGVEYVGCSADKSKHFYGFVLPTSHTKEEGAVVLRALDNIFAKIGASVGVPQTIARKANIF